MALVIPPGFAQVIHELTVTGDNEPMITTIGLDLSGLGGAFATAAEDAYNAFSSNFMAGAPSAVTLTQTILRIGQDGGDPLVVAEPGSSAGTGGATYLPQNSATLVQKRTALGGRKGRGRMFIPYLLEEQHVDLVGVISGVRLTSLQTAADGYLADLQLIGGGPVLLHDDATVGVLPAPTPITSLVVSNRIASQRQRLRR
jgi:hypothetical protein